MPLAGCKRLAQLLRLVPVFRLVPVLRLVPVVAGLGLAGLVTGCGMGPTAGPAVAPAAKAALAGHVHGGQQPVVGSHVFLYAVSTTANAGAATSLLDGAGYVLTGADGSFSISEDYTCPADAYVCLLAVGGNPGLAEGSENPELALGAGLGSCAALTDSAYFTINEVTTVGMAYALEAYATSETKIGSATAYDIETAFGNIDNFVDPVAGLALYVTPSGSGGVPQQKIDALANALGSCVNSDGSGAACSKLMTAANVHGANGTPIDTFQAALNIAQSPTANVQAVYDLGTPNSVFQPALGTAPADWTIAVAYSTMFPGVPPQPPSFMPPAEPGATPGGRSQPHPLDDPSCTMTCAFYDGSTDLPNGVVFLSFPSGNFFGYFSFLSNQEYIYHFDLGYEYVFDAGDGVDGIFLYDFDSSDYFYTNPSLFPYLYDYNLASRLYYYPDVNHPGHYNYEGIRYFYNFATGNVISK